MKNSEAIISILVIFCFALPVGCLQERPEKLMIAAAANTRYAIDELTRAFSKKTGVVCETIISSSGKLTAQIREGAPFDVFISADMKYPARLFREGFAAAAPERYAYGKLVLWSRDTTLIPSTDSFPGEPGIHTITALLTNGKLNHIALANPRTAPYGVAAVEVLKKAHVDETIKAKLVYGESISQVNQFISTGTSELGFTSLSSLRGSEIRGSEIKNMGNWIVLDTALYSPVAQGVVLVKNRRTRSGQAQAFYKFLLSGEGKRILHKFGYTTPSAD